MAYGRIHSKRRQDAAKMFSGPPVLAPRGEEPKQGKGMGALEIGTEVISRAPGAVGGAKMGMAAGAKLAPALAPIPVVGPFLAAAAPAVGGVVGGVSGAAMGGKATKSAKQMPGKLKDLRETAAEIYPKMFG